MFNEPGILYFSKAVSGLTSISSKFAFPEQFDRTDAAEIIRERSGVVFLFPASHSRGMTTLEEVLGEVARFAGLEAVTRDWECIPAAAVTSDGQTEKIRQASMIKKNISYDLMQNMNDYSVCYHVFPFLSILANSAKILGQNTRYKAIGWERFMVQQLESVEL